MTSYFRNLELDDWEQFTILDSQAFRRDPISKEDFIARHDKYIGLFNQEHVNRLIGYIYCRIYGDYSHLHRICVLNSEQGKGYGQKLMNKAQEFFKSNNVPNFALYVETNNNKAINLYKKNNLVISAESWHYIIDTDRFNSNILLKLNLEDKNVRELTLNEIYSLKTIFPDINFPEIENQFKEEQSKINRSNLFLGLFIDSDLKAFAKFNPEFSGSRPFVYNNIEDVNIFIALLMNYKLSDKKILRFTFDNYKNLANYFDSQNYVKHHHLYKMVKK